jgi:hypothetical protein
MTQQATTNVDGLLLLFKKVVWQVTLSKAFLHHTGYQYFKKIRFKELVCSQFPSQTNIPNYQFNLFISLLLVLAFYA